MKLLILTTDTKHHTFFINELSRFVDEVYVIYETKQLVKPYVTGPFFQEEQDEYEEGFFLNCPRVLSEDIRSQTRVYQTCNDDECISYIRKIQPDIIVSFGTGLLRSEVYQESRVCSLNVHRGYITEYRGLDSDLWALYNKEFDKIGVTIHYLNERLDAGGIVNQETINIDEKFEVFHIRYMTTLLATDMMKRILIDVSKTDLPPKSTSQKILGKYYSAMPLDKKQASKENLDLYFDDVQKGSPSATILLYHGVTKSKSKGIENYSHKHIEAEEFRDHMKYIRENLTPVSLREMSRILREEGPPEDCVAVTFDDSYKNVHDVALPILEEMSIPATFFITTGMVETSRKYWVDYLEDMISNTNSQEIQVELGKPRQFKVSSSEEKINCITEIKDFLKGVDLIRRTAVLEEVEEGTGYKEEGSPYTENYQNLSWDDVRRLDRSPLCEVGGHTVNHEIMSYLGDKELDREVNDCLAKLGEELERKIDLFSYPEGQEQHYNQKVIDKLNEAGITVSPSAIDGYNYRNEEPFHLKRIMVGYMEREFPWNVDNV